MALPLASPSSWACRPPPPTPTARRCLSSATCSASLEVIVAGGNATLLPGLVADGTQVGVPYWFRLSGVFAPTGGEPQPFVDGFSHPAFHQEGSLPDGTFVIDGEVWST